jgi:MFS family permease
MTQVAEARLGDAPGRFRDARIIGLVSGAHFVSHVVLMVLPPLFLFVRNDYNVSYAELGFVIAAFNVVSTVLQAPAGFLVDRMSPRLLLVGAMVLGATGLVFAALLPFYWALVVGWSIAGLANTIYHPADYAILSDKIGSRRIGQAFSMHTFFGMLGTAVTPAALLFLAGYFGWRGAVLGAAALGYAGALVLMQQKGALGEGVGAAVSARRPASGTASWDVLLSGPVLRNVVFFIVMSASGAGIYSFTIVGLDALYATPLPVASLGLSSFLLTNAVGVLAGGFVAARTERHDIVAVTGFAASGVAILVIALVPLNAPLLVLAFGIAGLLSGIIMPSRDMIVRAVTPEGAYGKVFGFVSTGFSIGAVIGPLLFGWLMDQGQPRLIFLLVAALTFAALPLMGRISPKAALSPSRSSG